MGHYKAYYIYVEISELIGCLLQHKLNDIINSGCHRLYRDDILIIIDNCTPRKWDIIRKKLHWLFDKFGFKLDIQDNLKITDYLDVTFNLYDGTVSPFRKNDQYPCCINIGSNHPRKVFKQISNSIMIRLSTNSSNGDIFTQNKQDYEIALKVVDIKKNSYIFHHTTCESACDTMSSSAANQGW